MTINSSNSPIPRQAGEPSRSSAPPASPPLPTLATPPTLTTSPNLTIPPPLRTSIREAPAPASPGDRRTAARLLIASVRLPAAGAAAGEPLLAALAPLAGDRRTLWIGLPPAAAAPASPAARSITAMPGSSASLAPAAAAQPREQLAGGVAGAIQTGGTAQRPVDLSAEERRSCDDGLVQHALWPLFHDLAPLARFELADWQAFRSINRKFARAVAQVLARGTGRDLLWVHDPLLMGLAAALRRRRSPAVATFFLHLPFPAADAFLRLPWREPLLAGLLAYRRLGFQTDRDLDNFLDAVRLIFPAVTARPAGGGAWELSGQSGAQSCACLAGVCPEGVDAAGIAAAAASPEVERRAAFLRDATAGNPPAPLGAAGVLGAAGTLGAAGARGAAGAPARVGAPAAPGHKIVLALDTLDPAQGTVLKLRAFAAALERQPALRDSATLLLRLIPDRLAGSCSPGAAPELRREVERTVGEINGRLGKAGRVPIHYRFGEIDDGERLALYRAADIAMVTPLRAGMELTAKAYCAADVTERGILLLSEFAGAAGQLRGALLVNPHDVAATAETLLGALRSTHSGRPVRPDLRERSQAPELPRTAELPEIPRRPEIPLPESPRRPEVEHAPEVRRVPEVKEIPEIPERPERPETTELSRRMRGLRAEVLRHDLAWWMRELLPEALAEPGAVQ